MKIFVTNLKDSVDRRRFMDEQFIRQNLDVEYVDCVIGADLDMATLKAECDLTSIDKQNEKVKWFTKGIIGCTMTNQNTYKRIVSENIPYALLLEDDIVLPPKLNSLILEIEGFIKPGDVILLFWKSSKVLKLKLNTKIELNKDVWVMNPSNTEALSGGSAFIVTKSAAERMLASNTPIKITPDSWHYFYKNECIDRLFITKPDVFKSAVLQSTMDIGKFKKLRTILNTIPVIKDILRYRRNSSYFNSQRIEII